MGGKLDFIVRVLGSEGDAEPAFRGSGLLVAPDRVLTCRHVVVEHAPYGQPTDRPLPELWVQPAAGPRLLVEKSVLAVNWDLAVLELATALPVEPPPLLWGLTQALDAKLRAAPLVVMGYAQTESEGPLWRHPLKDLWLLPSARETSQILTEVQLHGGIPTGCSGGPVLLPLGDRWACAGLVYLGGERSATSRLLLADPVVEFLHQCGLHAVARLDAVRALAAAPLDPAAAAALIERPSNAERLPNPYRGLSAFRAVDAPYFFGRQADTENLLGTVISNPFVALVGASGSGKSSLLFAGLVPRLRQDRRWLIASFRPKGDPFGEVATTLAPLLYPALDNVERREKRNQLAKKLTEGGLSLADAVAIVAEEHPEQRLLLIADQFEELYTQTLPEGGQRRFLQSLLSVVQHGLPGSLLIALRADFLSQALACRPLAETIAQHPKQIVPPIPETGLRAVIEGPAGQLGIRLEPGLAERILNDLGEEPGALPLLEFALTALWERQRDGLLTHAAYEAIGGVSEALAHYADTVAARFQDQEAHLHRVFVQLVRPGEGTEDSRQVATREQVGEAEWALVKQLADARLVVTSAHEEEDRAGTKRTVETVEVVHEALIQHWQPLREWIDQDRQFRMWQNRLRQALQDWEENYREDGALLRGARLIEAEERLEAHRDILTSAEREYVAASLALREREARTRRQTQLRTITGLVAGLIVALALAGVATFQWQQTWAERNRAQTAQAVALARQLAAQATLTLTSPPTDLVRGALLATESLRRTHTLEGYSAWTTAMSLLPRGVVRLQHRDPVRQLAFSPDGAQLAAAVSDGTTAAGRAHLWDTATGQPLAAFDQAGWVVAAAFSPDGTLLATGSWDHTVAIADAETGQERRRLPRDDAISALAFSPDGKRLAVGEKDGTLGVIDPGSGRDLVRVKQAGRIAALAFSADGSRLAAASEDKTVIVWNSASGMEIKRLAYQGSMQALAFGPAGPRLVTWDNDDQKAGLFDAETGKILATLDTYKVEFTADGSRFVAGGGKQVSLWDAASGRQLASRMHDAFVRGLAASPSGALVAIADSKHRVTVWDTAEGRERFRITHDADVTGVAFSPDGQKIATTSNDKLVRLWDLSSGQELARLAHAGAPEAPVFSPDSRWLLTTDGLSDYNHKYAWGELVLWSAEDWRQMARLAAYPIGLGGISFGRRGEVIATVRSDKTVRLIDAKAGSELARLTFEKEVGSARLTADGARVLVKKGGFGAVEVWDVGERRRLASLSDPGGVYEINFDRAHRLVATTGFDGAFRIWEVATGTELHRFDGGCCLSADGKLYLRRPDNAVEIRQVATDTPVSRLPVHAESSLMGLSPDGRRLAVRRSILEVELWDTAQQTLIARLFHPYHRPPGERSHPNELKQMPIIQLEFSPNGELVATAGPDGRVYLWEAETGRLVRQVEPRLPSRSVAVRFSDDGRRLVTVNDGIVSIWDTGTGQKVRDLAWDKDKNFNSPVFSPDGLRLAFGVGGNAQVWDTEQGRLLFDFPISEKSAVTALGFYPDGSLLAVGSYDAGSGVHVLDLNTGKERLRLLLGAHLTGIVFTADGNRLITHDAGWVARAWDMRTGQEVFRFAHDAGTTERITYDAGAGRAATTQQALVRVWDTTSGRRIAEFRHDDRVGLVALSPDGTRLATHQESASHVDVLKVESGLATGDASAATLFTLRHEDRIEALAFSADGTVIVTGGQDGARLWDATAGKELARFSPQEGDVTRVVLNDDKTMLATSVDKSYPSSDEVQLWQVPTRRKLAVVPLDASEMAFRPGTATLAIADGKTTVRIVDPTAAKPELTRLALGRRLRETAISPDGRLLATRRYDAAEAEIWDLETEKPLGRVAHDDVIWDIAFTPDGGRLATISKDNTTRLWEAKTGRELLRLSPPNGNSSLRFSPDGRRIVIRLPRWSSEIVEDDIELRDTASGAVVGQPITGFIGAIAFSPDGRYLATAEGAYSKWKDASTPQDRLGFFGARIWEAETGWELLRLPHKSNVFGIAFSPDGTLLATSTGESGDPLRLWSTQTGKLVAEVASPPKSQLVREFAFSPDGRLLAAKTSNGNEISVWRMSDYTQVGLLIHEKSIDSFAFSPDGRLLVAEADKKGWVWDWAAGRVTIRLPELQSFQFTPDGKRLITVHEDDTVRVWQLSADDLIADACSRLERNLTPDEWRTYLGSEPYRATCPGLPVPER